MRDTSDTDEKRVGKPGPLDRPDPDTNDEQDPDFVVTEAHDQGPELVGGVKASGSGDLGIESTADLMQQEARQNELHPEDAEGFTSLPIGASDPPGPPEADYSDEAERTDRLQLSPDSLEAPTRESRLEKVSDQRLEEISRRMQAESGQSGYLSEEEKLRLITSIDSTPESETPAGPDQPGEKPAAKGFDNQPIVPPRRKEGSRPAPADLPLPGEKPRISKRLRGVAYFAKGYIKITGEQELREGDELSVNGREYLLRQKKVSNKFLWTVLSPVAAILIFLLGALLSPDADTGAGKIVGVALDQHEQPLLSGALVRLPQLGQAYQTNSQGFFESAELDAGSYKIEYIVGDQVLATDYATVVDERITMIMLHPEQVTPTRRQPVPVRQSRPQLDNQSPSQPTASSPPPPKPAAVSKKTDNIRAAAPTPKWSRLALNANVDGARLTVDGSVLGAGNLTYTKLKPGKHSYAVSKEGYQTAEGTVQLKAGQLSRLALTLNPASGEQKAESYLEQDYYYSGLNAVESGDFNTAITDFSEAIKLSPSYADAYLKRAEAYQRMRDNRAAHDDYIRAAEIYQFRNDYRQAFSAFGDALKLNSKSIPAYLGRGNLYLGRNEDIAAIADFDMVIRLDKRNLQGYIGLGQARYNQGYYGKAAKRFNDARSINSEDPMIYQYLMLCYFGADDIKQVRKNHDRFLKYASEAEIEQMRADPRFTAVLRVTEN